MLVEGFAGNKRAYKTFRVNDIGRLDKRQTDDMGGGVSDFGASSVEVFTVTDLPGTIIASVGAAVEGYVVLTLEGIAVALDVLKSSDGFRSRASSVSVSGHSSSKSTNSSEWLVSKVNACFRSGCGTPEGQ